MTAAQWICYFAFSLADMRDDLCFSDALEVGQAMIDRFREVAPEACAQVICSTWFH